MGGTLHVINYPRVENPINLIYVKIGDNENGNLINYESNKMISIQNTDYDAFKKAVENRDKLVPGGLTDANSSSQRQEFDDIITKTLAMFNKTGGGRKTRRRRKQHKKKSRKSRN